MYLFDYVIMIKVYVTEEHEMPGFQRVYESHEPVRVYCDPTSVSYNHGQRVHELPDPRYPRGFVGEKSEYTNLEPLSYYQPASTPGGTPGYLFHPPYEAPPYPSPAQYIDTRPYVHHSAFGGPYEQHQGS